jgi:hypothetical protein
MRILVTGLVAQYAFGGVAWDYLQYVEGFRQLGHDVFYLEDTETWPYDPVQQTYTADSAYNVAYLRGVMDRLDLGDRWIYRNGATGAYHGHTADQVRHICASTQLFLNVSGAGWLRPEYTGIRTKIFLDSDPMFNQIGLLNAGPQEQARVRAHDRHFTFAENIGQPDCRVPSAGFAWIPTRQPVVLDWFPPGTRAGRNVWTTVMNWVSYKASEHAGETWGQKDIEFMKFVDLPAHTAERFEIAMGRGSGGTRPTALLQQNGWTIVEPDQALPDPWSYREYLATSKGEWSIAKEGYVKSRSGWFSGRSACYLALGRPCVLQDTGWSKYYPTGHGLLPFTTPAEAAAALDQVAGHYEAHCRAARQIAAQHLEARRVLAKLLAEAGL